ncbi:hypothetical protein BD408DRAFT_433829 [Parasitella parasitica]|nr:hypothetical protein BD408DRAFT_433829 [Parasitella parasitica]
MQFLDIEIELVLRSLIDAIESGALDGFIWAMCDSANQSNNMHDMMQERYKHAQFVEWASHMDTLSYPYTKSFVWYAGLEPLHEAAYVGVCKAFYPFYGDQMSNSKKSTVLLET